MTPGFFFRAFGFEHRPLFAAFAFGLFRHLLRFFQRQFLLALAFSVFLVPPLFERGNLLLPLALGSLCREFGLARRGLLLAFAFSFFGGALLLTCGDLQFAFAFGRLFCRDRQRFGRQKIKIFFQRSALPRDLLAVGAAAHVQAYALENILDLRIGRFHLAQQVFGVDPIRAFAVARHVARRGGIGQQRAVRRIHLRQAPRL